MTVEAELSRSCDKCASVSGVPLRRSNGLLLTLLSSERAIVCTVLFAETVVVVFLEDRKHHGKGSAPPFLAGH